MTRLDRSSWFAIAARLLAEQGAQGLRVDMLGQATGVAKGSFYHHFRQLTEFKAEFTAHLYNRGVGKFLSQLVHIEPPQKRLSGLAERTSDHYRRMTRLLNRITQA
ncbi:MAG: helix-turn-helix transcriptional regulator [Propionibacterium sp.]|nr:helix-turn-helix transcriptional regulator [Propionibacterium sp.]MBB1576464.1 helix-turn-helix transcriptional regulator [Propionibacterium sp.]